MANPKVTADPTWYVGDGLEGQGYGEFVARKTVTFDAGAGSGAVGTVALFTVTGAVIVRLVAICTVDLTIAAGATLEVGTAGTVDGLIAQTAGDAIDAGEIWFAAAPATVLDTLANGMLSYIIGDGADIIATVGTDAINTGTIVFTVFWTPLTANGAVVAA
jgi:hypothetical protein